MRRIPFSDGWTIDPFGRTRTDSGLTAIVIESPELRLRTAA
jgi:hypothetical protein